MATYTQTLQLLKKDPVMDGTDTFNIETMLNENWDKLDAHAKAMLSVVELSGADTPAAGVRTHYRSILDAPGYLPVSPPPSPVMAAALDVEGVGIIQGAVAPSGGGAEVLAIQF